MSCYTPIDNLPLTGKTHLTDYSRWKLTYTDDGGHIWKYLSDEELQENPQTTIEKFWLGLPLDTKPLIAAKDGLSAARNGLNFLKRLQADDGHWAGAYSGPMFLLPGVVIGSYVTGMPFKEEERLEIIRYLFNRAHPVDGGWGLHIEGPSTVLGITINYMSLRILGVPAEHPIMVKARGTLHKLGGATHAPQWAVFWMCVMNVYDWEGCNPIPPEFWAMPDWVPFHPWRWWIHCRQVYVPMSYLYGIRWHIPENDLVLALRQELYAEDFYQIDWPSVRNTVAAPDLYVPHSPLLKFANVILGAYENCALPPFRRMALDVVYNQIKYEDDNTGYQDLAPVNMMMNAVVRYVVEGPESEAYKRHMDVRADSMWVSEEGLFVGGTNGSQLWDIVFITQAMVESELGNEKENRESLLKALQWLDMCQIKQDPPFMKEGYRHASKGAWPFSTRTQGYTVSDCTGEAVKSVIYIQEHVPFPPHRYLSSTESMLQLTFGAFGDIVTLIDLILKVKTCIIHGAYAPEEIQEFVDFLELYVQSLHCIQSILTMEAAKNLPYALQNAITHALSESKKIVEDYLVTLKHCRPVIGWGASAVLAIKWVLSNKKTMQDLQAKLVDKGNSITLLLTLSGLRTTLDFGKSIAHHMLPAQPQVESVRLVDFLDRRTNVPLEFCVDEATFRQFLLIYFRNRTGLELILQDDYEVRLLNSRTSRQPWDVRPGETLSMSAILRAKEGKRRCCPSCSTYQTEVHEYNGEIKCSGCKTFFRVVARQSVLSSQKQSEDRTKGSKTKPPKSIDPKYIKHILLQVFYANTEAKRGRSRLKREPDYPGSGWYSRTSVKRYSSREVGLFGPRSPSPSDSERPPKPKPNPRRKPKSKSKKRLPQGSDYYPPLTTEEKKRIGLFGPASSDSQLGSEAKENSPRIEVLEDEPQTRPLDQPTGHEESWDTPDIELLPISDADSEETLDNCERLVPLVLPNVLDLSVSVYTVEGSKYSALSL